MTFMISPKQGIRCLFGKDTTLANCKLYNSQQPLYFYKIRYEICRLLRMDFNIRTFMDIAI